ncbi:MAG: 2OG-Fe dioxygenase family protein [Sulfitobacter sp.]
MSEHSIATALHDGGYARYNPATFGAAFDKADEADQIKAYFGDLALDPYSKGNRFRAYAQFKSEGGELVFGKFEDYLQTKKYNPVTGGIIRDYPPISPDILQTETMQKLLEQDIEICRQLPGIPPLDEMMNGIHFFRYRADVDTPAYSSPAWLHRDDETVVFLHLIDRSADLLGGDNIIATSGADIETVLSLDSFLDTLVVNQKKLHAVTPMGTPSHYKPGEFVYRDIILVTFQVRDADV